MEENKFCCNKPMEFIPEMNGYACAYCGKMISKSGMVTNPGRKK